MTYFYIFKDGAIIGRCATKDQAVSMIRSYQEMEKKAHQWLRAEFTLIEGKAEETITYT